MKLKCLLAMLLLTFLSCSNTPAVEDKIDSLPHSEPGKTLIVYFSWSGHTQTLANIIHELIGCDMVEIEPEEPYSDEYNEVVVPTNDTLWLALCLYTPLAFDIPAKCMIINSIDGHVTELEEYNNEKILSVREKQVLKLIDKGLMSKDIAEMLSISIYTVNRHRQEILGKLQVKNSIEACRIAKDLKLI